MRNQRTLILYVSIALFVSISWHVGFGPLEGFIPVDAVLSGIIASGLLVLLRLIIKYSHFSALIFIQRAIIYLALALLFTICWIGSELILLYLWLPVDYDWSFFMTTLPLRIIIVLLVYALALSVYNKKYEDIPVDEDINESDIPGVLKSGVSADNSFSQTAYPERITVKNGQKVEIIPIENIISLQADGDYVKIHTEKGRFIKEQTMKSFENLLPPDKFVRIHRSSIVNIEYIVQIELYDKQNQLMKLKNGMQLKISKSGYIALKKVLNL